MVERRLVRIGVTFNRTFYFVDKGMQRGVSYEYGQLVEERLNKHVKTGTSNKVHVVFVPLPRSHAAPALVDGKVDLVAAQVTVTPDRQELVDFTNPTRMNVSQSARHRPRGPAAALRLTPCPAGRSSSARRAATIRACSRSTTGSRPRGSRRCDSHRAGEPRGRRPARDGERGADSGHHRRRLSRGLLEEGVSESDRSRRRRRPHRRHLAVAVRKNSPQLVGGVEHVHGQLRLGTAFGNMVERKYLVNTTYAKSAARRGRAQKFLALVQLFRKYSDQYNVDYLLMAAQGYQESRLNQNARSARRRHRHHAAHAGDRQGAEGRRHQAGRAQYPCRRQVHARDGRHVLQERADGQSEQSVVYLRVL